VVQDGEQCDPPGGACTDTCQLAIDTCTNCISQVREPSNRCEGDIFLNGTDEYGPGYEVGCINDEACFDLWNCYRTTQCILRADLFFHACYCGALPDGTAVDFNECIKPTYEPSGVCREETLAAFEAQWKRQPFSNAEVLEKYLTFEKAEGARTFSYAAATYPAYTCLVDPAVTRETLVASGVTDPPVDECISACFP
jgi:hypothetical protein